MRKNKDLAQSALIRIMSGVVLGALISFLLCVGILLAAATGISAGVIGDGMQYQVTLFACLIAVAIGGIFATKRYRNVLMGIGTGIVFYLCLLTIGVFLYEVRPLEQGGIGVLCACLVGGALAGLAGGRHSKKRRR